MEIMPVGYTYGLENTESECFIGVEMIPEAEN